MNTEIEKVGEEVIEQDEVTETSNDKTIDELKAEAEKLEKEYREKRDGSKDEEIKANMLRRIEKAKGKLEAVSEVERPVRKENIETLGVRELLVLDKAGIQENSEKAEILARYRKAGFFTDYADGINHAGVVAEFAQIDAKTIAKTIIDDNNSEASAMKTRREIIMDYKKNGEIPTDPSFRKLIADENLKDMGI